MTDDLPTEKRCPQCGESKPISEFWKCKGRKHGCQSYCKICQQARRDAHYSANRQTILDQQRARYASNVQKIREYHKAWRLANLERERERERLWRATHLEKARKVKRDWHSSNPDHAKEINRLSSRRIRATNPMRIREIERAYRASHPDVIRAKNHRRRARKKDNGGTFTHKELTAMRLAQNGICAYCKLQYDPNALTMDHIIPLAQGGRHEAPNICLACPRCNNSKNNRTPEQWTNRWYLRKDKSDLE